MIQLIEGLNFGKPAKVPLAPYSVNTNFKKINLGKIAVFKRDTADKSLQNHAFRTKRFHYVREHFSLPKPYKAS